MTSRTKRINRAMTTPITDAIETGSEKKRKYMNYEIIHNNSKYINYIFLEFTCQIM